ncbi:MAG: T9SS type A sorting domain-containing protein [Bacteroidetes bacterium]|nr:T9SS type A sorting domain-containing protein [Bacteroidota bacterium]
MKTLTVLILCLIIPFVLTAQWYLQASGTTENLASIYFADTLNGWVTGSNGAILHTDDAGENWEEQTINTDYYLNDVFFTDPNHGWVVGSQYDGYGQGSLFRTLNGGNNWKDMNFEDFPSNGVFFTDTLCGWAVGYGIKHTADGGETWESQNVPSGFGIARCVWFTDSLNGWVSGGHSNGSTGYIYGYIIHTSDGGNTWEYQFYYADRHGYELCDIYFTDSLNGWCVGGLWNDIILKTTNGGNSWDTSYYSTGNNGLYSVYFIDSFNGWAVGENGSIISTTDGGNTWESDTSNTSYHLKSVYFTENGHGWVVGDEGTILHADYSQIVGLDEFGDHSFNLGILCYPNPCSGTAFLRFTVNDYRLTICDLYSISGLWIRRLVNEVMPAGVHEMELDVSSLPDGIYILRLQADSEVVTRKLVKINH